MVDKRSLGRRGHAPPPWPASSSSSSCRSQGWKTSLSGSSAVLEQKNNSAKATSSMEFMSCSSTQGQCGTQTQGRDFLRFFIVERTHTHGIVQTAGLFMPHGKNARQPADSLRALRDGTVTSNRRRPADPSCNGTVSCTHSRRTT